jgi:hypothetical protein
MVASECVEKIVLVSSRLHAFPGTRLLPLCRNLVMNLIWAPDEEPLRMRDWSLTWRWPADARILSPLLSLANILYSWSLHRLYWFPLLRSMLIGPWFSVQMATISVLAASSLWKRKPWARGWAIAASLMFFVMYFRQFIVPVRPTWSHGLVTLSIGMIGLFSFAWPEKQVDLSRSGSDNS